MRKESGGFQAYCREQAPDFHTVLVNLISKLDLAGHILHPEIANSQSFGC